MESNFGRATDDFLRGRMNMKRFTWTASALAVLTAAVYAAAVWSGGALVLRASEGEAAGVAPSGDAPPAGAARLLSRLEAARPDIAAQVLDVEPAPIPGLFVLSLPGGTMLYGTADGRHLIAGDLYELTDGELVNLAEVERAETRRRLIAAVPRGDMIVFTPAGPTKAAISVFTDVDCGYCQLLHREVPELNQLGIEVRYLGYPRGGIGSDTHRKMTSAWCARDPNEAITRLKARETIPPATCDNPIARHFELGGAVGVNGTPAIVLEDGRLLPGYLPAERLAAILGL
jgi:thiol:disulfide interchange protein DsbC